MKTISVLIIGYMLFSIQMFAHSTVKVPRIIGNNMVLQRGLPVPIWGWADVGERVSVTLSKQSEVANPIYTRTTTADAKGQWQTNFPAMPAGGPYVLRITGRNTLELKNVLFGEVWVCSGQSNMEWSVRASKDSTAEIAAANYQNIRLFHVPRKASAVPQYDVDAGLA